MTPNLDVMVQPNGLSSIQFPTGNLVSSGPFTPAQIRHGYGFDQINFQTSPIKGFVLPRVPGDGRGQTIAIVDAFDDPSVAADLNTFDQRYGLTAAQLTVVKQNVSGIAPRYNAD
jgi:subtilase family serine protease